MALRCYNMAKKEGLTNNGRYVASLELVVVLYQMLGDLDNAIWYSRIHPGAIRGHQGLVTLRRHWKDLCTYRAFHVCVPWWKARVKSTISSWEPYEDFFDLGKGGLRLQPLVIASTLWCPSFSEPPKTMVWLQLHQDMVVQSSLCLFRR